MVLPRPAEDNDAFAGILLIDQAGMPEEACRRHADALWRCIQKEAAPRPDATLEQHRVDLGDLQEAPTGLV